MKATFDNTVSILVKAYLNGTLEHEDCTKCVVGNLCGGESGWQYLFTTDPKLKRQFPKHISNMREFMLGKTKDEILKEAHELCLSTGYSVEELKRIEYAFETAPGFKEEEIEFDDDGFVVEQENDEWMFNGLMAVIEVLADIHSVDLSVKEEAKQLFVKVQ